MATRNRIRNGVNRLQVLEQKWHSGLTESNHLSNMYLTQPEDAMEVTDYIFSRNGRCPLSMLTALSPTIKTVGNRQWGWSMVGDNERSLPLVEASRINQTTPLISGETGYLIFPANDFVVGDVLSAENGQTVRVVSDPESLGNGSYEVRVKLDGASNKDAFLDPTMIESGRAWSKDYTKVAEGEGGGNTTYSSFLSFRNQLTTIVKSASITGSAATDVMVIKIPVYDKDNKKKIYTEKWTTLQEFTLLQQWYREKERLFMYSRHSNDNTGQISNFSENGRPLYSGAGIRQQLEGGVVRYANRYTRELIQDFLMELSYNKKDEGERKFVALTGEWGMLGFQEAMENAIKDWQVIDTTFVNAKGNVLQFNQYKTFKGFNGTELTLMPYPLYDDNVSARSKNLHHVTKRPLESYRMTVIDVSTNNGKNNLMRVAKEDRENAMFHVAGAVSPAGMAKSLMTARSHNQDSYSLHCLAEIGIQLTNPFTSGEIIIQN